MNKTLAKLCALSVLLAVVGTAHAEIYKWTDANGSVHYTQTPPPDPSQAKDIGQEISLSTGKAQKGSNNATPTAKQDKEKDDIEKARDDGTKNAEKHQTFCDQQNAALKQLLANPVIRWKSATEEEKILSAKERTDKIAEFEKNIKELCNKEVLPEKTSKAE